MKKRTMRRPFFVCVATLIAGSALASEPHAVSSYPSDWPHRAPWKLNRELLLPETERVVLVVDRARGAPPVPEALDHLAALASKYGGRPASWVVLGEPGAPAVRWVEPSPLPKPVNLYVRLPDGQSLDGFHVPRDDVETARYLSQVPSCPSGPLPPSVSFVFVRYLGAVGYGYGSADVVASGASCGERRFPVIRVAQDTIALDRAPGISQSFLERRTLAHEYGHVLGLGSNPAHGWWMSRTPYRGGPHCIHRECAVALPTAGALVKGEMLDYCPFCLRDIEHAREHWQTGREFPETPRLPQPDPVAQVARLKDYNFREGGEAEKLFGYGKAVMPPLFDRMTKLPGGSPASPRSYAVRLALRIIAHEDGVRRASRSPDPAIPVGTGDASESLLAWWRRESERFMSGDDWAMPAATPAEPHGP